MKTSDQLAVLEDFFLENGFAMTDVDYMGSGTVNFVLRDAKTKNKVAWLRIEQDNQIIVEYEFKPGVRKMLLRSGLVQHIREKPDHLRYHTQYVHKISLSERDGGRDAVLSPAHLGNKTRLGAALRDQRVLGKGERIRDYRVESSGRVVVFPSSSIWHSIILTPV